MNQHKPVSGLAAGYDRDLYAWSQDQAKRLRVLRPAQVDWEHVAEEIESLGKADRRGLQSDLKIVLLHLIKWQYQPRRRKSGWRASINEHRDRMVRILRDSPSLVRVPSESLAEEYRRARIEALAEMGEGEGTVPQSCPFTIEQILDPDFWPEAPTR